MKLYFILVGILLLALYFMTTGKAKYQHPKEWIVYGTMGCGWTRKQLDHLKENGTGYKFIDCDSGECPAEVKAYPTCKLPSGEMKVGFTSVH